MLDTNIYIDWIRRQAHEEILLERGTIKYLSAVVLMELWAGAKTRQSSRVVETLQKPYLKADRVVALGPAHFVAMGGLLSAIHPEHKGLIKSSAFINDLQIAVAAASIGAVLRTSDRVHFKIIGSYFKKLRVEFV